MSNMWTFRCVASSLPCGEKSNEVLWYFSVAGTYSGILPPSTYALDSAARADKAWNVGDCSCVGGEGSKVSAYLGKWAVP